MTGIQHGVAQFFQPRPQPRHLGAAPHRVRPFDHDELPLQLGTVDARKRSAVKRKRLTHWRGIDSPRDTPGLRRGLRPNSRSTMRRISPLLRFDGLGGVDDVESHSSIMASYSTRMRPWKMRKLSSMLRLSPRSMPAS